MIVFGAVLINTCYLQSTIHVEPQAPVPRSLHHVLIVSIRNVGNTAVPVYPYKQNMVESFEALKLDDPIVHTAGTLVHINDRVRKHEDDP